MIRFYVEPKSYVCRCVVVKSSHMAYTQITRCVDGIGDGTVKSDRSVVVLHHFGLGRTIGFHTIGMECNTAMNLGNVQQRKRRIHFALRSNYDYYK